MAAKKTGRSAFAPRTPPLPFEVETRHTRNAGHRLATVFGAPTFAPVNSPPPLLVNEGAPCGRQCFDGYRWLNKEILARNSARLCFAEEVLFFLFLTHIHLVVGVFTQDCA